MYEPADQVILQEFPIIPLAAHEFVQLQCLSAATPDTTNDCSN
jgi:hypothetical protein